MFVSRCVHVCLCVCTSAPSLAHAGFLGLGHPVIFGRHGNRPEVTWNDQSAVKVLATGKVVVASREGGD